MISTKLLLAVVCSLCIPIGIYELKNNFVIVNPVPADLFEYEFDLLNGAVTANPFGTSK